MADQSHGPQYDPVNDPDDLAGFVDRRHARVVHAIQRGRQSRIPTWVLALTLALIIAAWVVFIALG